ncbi:ComEA family DNA-binding protein [Luteimonas sp. e5]
MKSILAPLQALLLASCLFAGNAFAAEVVNINTADAATLSRTLNGVGPAKAQAIIDYREANGPFKSAEQLAMVKGIGLKTVERNIEFISVNGAAPTRSTTPERKEPPVSSRQAAMRR